MWGCSGHFLVGVWCYVVFCGVLYSVLFWIVHCIVVVDHPFNCALGIVWLLSIRMLLIAGCSRSGDLLCCVCFKCVSFFAERWALRFWRLFSVVSFLSLFCLMLVFGSLILWGSLFFSMDGGMPPGRFLYGIFMNGLFVSIVKFYPFCLLVFEEFFVWEFVFGVWYRAVSDASFQGFDCYFAQMLNPLLLVIDLILVW